MRVDSNSCFPDKKLTIKCGENYTFDPSNYFNYTDVVLEKGIDEGYYLTNLNSNYYDGLIVKSKPKEDKFFVKDTNSDEEYLGEVVQNDVDGNYYISLSKIPEDKNVEEVFIVNNELVEENSSSIILRIIFALGILSLVILFFYIVYYIRKIHR